MSQPQLSSPPPSPSKPDLTRNNADSIIIRIEVSFPGMESTLTKRFLKTATIQDVITQCRSTLLPALQGCAFHIKTKTGLRLPDERPLENCSLQNMQVLCMVPENEGEVQRILNSSSGISSSTPSSPDSGVAYSRVLKSGFLNVIRVKRRRGSTQRRRWCVLKGGKILMFASPKDAEYTELVDLDKNKLSFPTDPSKQSSSSQGPLSPPLASQGKTKDRPFLEVTTLDGSEVYTFCAETEKDAEGWSRAVVSRRAEATEGSVEARVLNASVAGYLVRKIDGGGSQRKFATLVDTELSFMESPADSSQPQTVALFSQKIVYTVGRREIEFSALGEVGFTLQYANDTDFWEWVRALRAVLPNFVTDGDELLKVDTRSGVVKAGWLTKKKVNRRFSSAKKRWFVLKDKRLYYLHTPMDTIALGYIDLMHSKATFLSSQPIPTQQSSSSLGSTSETVPSLQTSSVVGGSAPSVVVSDARIELVTPGATYILRCPDSVTGFDTHDWFECIQANCVGNPFNVVHKQHVDFDYNWCVGNPLEMFDFEEKIGLGAFAAVYRAKQRETGFDLAIKLLRLEEDTAEALKGEIDVLKRCRSTQIVTYFGTCSLPGQLWVLTELCKCGSIKDIMKLTLETLNEAQLAFVCTETLKGLCYLHSLNIIHHDIKAGNILLTEEGQPKLADFGVSQQFHNTDRIVAQNYIGSPLYMSPEVLRKSVYNTKTDVWSLGITVIEMAEGSPPNAGVTSFKALLQRHEHAPPRLSPSGGWSTVINDFVAHCLVIDVATRASPIDLLAHPFLATRQKADCMMPLVNQCLQSHAASQTNTGGHIIPEVVDPTTGKTVSAAHLAEQMRVLQELKKKQERKEKKAAEDKERLEKLMQLRLKQNKERLEQGCPQPQQQQQQITLAPLPDSVQSLVQAPVNESHSNEKPAPPPTLPAGALSLPSPSLGPNPLTLPGMPLIVISPMAPQSGGPSSSEEQLGPLPPAQQTQQISQQSTLPPPQLPAEALSPRPVPLCPPSSTSEQMASQIPGLSSPGQTAAQNPLHLPSPVSKPSDAVMGLGMPQLEPLIPRETIELDLTDPLEPSIPKMEPVVPLPSINGLDELVSKPRTDSLGPSDFTAEGATSTQFTSIAQEFVNSPTPM